MSMDFEDREPVNTSNDSPLFGATPVWERGRKRRGFGARRPAEPRTFTPEDETPMTLDRPLERPIERPVERPLSGPSLTETNSTMATATMPAEDETLVAPIGARTTTRARASNSSAPAALIVGGVVAVAAVAGAGWYAMRGHEGVPEMTPGATTSQVATAPLPPPVPTSDAPTQVAANTPPPAMERPLSQAAPAHARVAPARASTHHVARASHAMSAETGAANASARTSLPDGPQPYGAVNPQATPAPVAPAAPAPTVQQAAPPTNPAPESIPSTPPVSPPASPAPQQSAPTPPDTQATPPTN